MPEKSIFWETGALGDGASEYTLTELTRWLSQSFASTTVDEAIMKNYGGEMAVSGVASPVSIATGGALVHGFPYWHTVASTIIINTPVGDTRIDRIVLSADYVAQTVRLTLLTGIEGGGIPAMTHNTGVLWEIPLARVSITVGGVITLTDERVFLHPGWDIEAGMFNADVAGAAVELDAGALAVKVDDTTIEISADNLQIKAGGLDNTHFANRTRRLWVPSTECYNNTGVNYMNAILQGWEMVDNAICECYGHFRVPADYSSGLNITPVIIPGGTGDVYAKMEAAYGALGEDHDTHTYARGYTQITGAAINETDELSEIALTTWAFAPTSGDYVCVTFLRDSTGISDSVNATVYFVGFVVAYTADM